MNVRIRRRSALVVGALSLSLLAAACGSSKKDSGSADTTAASATTAAGATAATTSGGSATTKPANLSATLNASGATFPKAFYEEVIADFTKANSGVKINYAGGGSGKGRQDLADQIVDWAGSDSAPIKPEDASKFKGGEVLYFPTVVAPITISYNLDGVDKLQLSATTVAKIFQRDIKTWDDPAIAADNPGVKLPSTPIVVARRADSSGTTDNFTKFLDKSVGSSGTEAQGVWKLKSGSTVEWPADTQAGQGNAGVAQIVKSTKGAVGYVDLSDAKASDLTAAAIKNRSGKYVEPTLEGASAAAAGAKINPDLTYSAVWAEGDAAYPVTAQTWILVYAKQTDKSKGEALKAFLQYVLTDGQKTAPDVDFAPLPKGLDDQAIAQLDKIQLPS